MPRPKRSGAKETKATAQPRANEPPPRRKSRAAKLHERNNSGATSVLPRFIPPALCALVPKPPVSGDWVHEVKFDGWRIQIRVEDGSAKLLTRNGFDWTRKFPEMAKQARGLDNCIIDGELCAIDADGLPDFAALQASMEADTTDDLIYFAFDAMFAEDRDIRRLSLFERKEQLRKLLDDAGGPPSIRYVTHLEMDGKDVIKAACEMKLEGIISKRVSAPYVSGRKGTWTKSKCRAGQHAVVGGYVTGPEGFRSLLLGVPNGKRLVPIGRVGTGFPQKLLTWLRPKLRALETEKSPFSAVIPRKPQRKLHYLKPQLVAEVEFTSWTSDGVLRQASLKSLHEKTDKELRPDWINLPEGLQDGREGLVSRPASSGKRAR